VGTVLAICVRPFKASWPDGHLLAMPVDEGPTTASATQVERDYRRRSVRRQGLRRPLHLPPVAEVPLGKATDLHGRVAGYGQVLG
jgi:hypothetical protein